MSLSSRNSILFSVVCWSLILAFVLAYTARVNVEAKSYPVASASKSRRLAVDSRIRDYVRAEEPSASAPSPSPPTNRKTSTQKKLKIWALGFFLGAIAGIITGIVLSILYKVIAVVRGRRRRTAPTIYSPLINPESLSFLDNEARVKELEIIGEGACGVVYKAPLNGEDEKLLAIKKIEVPETVSGENLNKNVVQMRSEMDTVGHVRHKNIVPLLAHVAGNGCHYLIYEFMKNGSLHHALKDVAADKREIEWAVRKKIAVGIALGLEHIHSYSYQRKKIFHRDLKPANILLDEEMEARIADFGLATLVAEGKAHASIIGGTAGYMDPTAPINTFTEKSDIYAFGMTIGALVTGKEPADPFFQETPELYMQKWLRNVFNSDNPSDAIDPKLKGKGFEEEILVVLRVACLCTLDDASKRPNAKEAREMLTQI